jgi:hypothetical protein
MTGTFVTRALGGLILAAAILFGGAAHADEGFMPWSDVIKKAMADHPGLTMDAMHDFATREKQFVGFEPWMKANFKDVDANKDGMITMDEMHVWMTAHKMTDSALTKNWYGK